VAVALRWAVLDDLEQLQRLYRRSASVWASSRPILEANPELVEPVAASIDDRHVRVAVDQGRLAGFSTVVPGEPGAAELDALFVDPPDMGRGLGRALVADAAEVARAAGLARLDVVANPEAVGFYERVGFVATGPSITEHGPAVRMVLAVG
jgi:GNAT superfamily N-acetyltransferase